MQVNYTPHLLFGNSGYVQSTVPIEFRASIQQEIDEIYERQDHPYNNGLVGQIGNEQGLKKLSKNEDFNLFLKALRRAYDDNFDDVTSHHVGLVDEVKQVKDYWVNFQTKGEYNPPHFHTGCYSFVIWVKIPYDLQKELKVFENSKDTSHSCFNFMFQRGRFMVNEALYIDQSYEWEIVLFPAYRTHFVNPFTTCDGTRVSIAGNLYSSLTTET